MIEEDKITLDKPDIQLIDDDKLVTISLYTYNHLMYDSFKFQNAKVLYDVTKEKLDSIFNIIINEENYFIKDIRETITNIYYGIEDNKIDK